MGDNPPYGIKAKKRTCGMPTRGKPSNPRSPCSFAPRIRARPDPKDLSFLVDMIPVLVAYAPRPVPFRSFALYEPLDRRRCRTAAQRDNTCNRCTAVSGQQDNCLLHHLDDLGHPVLASPQRNIGVDTLAAVVLLRRRRGFPTNELHILQVGT